MSCLWVDNTGLEACLQHYKLLFAAHQVYRIKPVWLWCQGLLLCSCFLIVRDTIQNWWERKSWSLPSSRVFGCISLTVYHLQRTKETLRKPKVVQPKPDGSRQWYKLKHMQWKAFIRSRHFYRLLEICSWCTVVC